MINKVTKLTNKVTKLTRFWQGRLRPRSLPPLFWHIGVPNFGDDINPALYEELCGRRLRLATDRRVPHFLGMGSILAAATESSIVLGAGLIRPANVKRPLKVVSLRGELTRQHLGITEDIPLGDPMVLVSQLMTPERGGDIGFIPHVSELHRIRDRIPPNIKLIDVRRQPTEVVREIGRCSLVLSQSLHGLIVADAFDIPNLWIAPSKKMMGGEFKFHDYFSTLDGPKEKHEFSFELLANPTRSLASVGRFKGNKAEYRAILRDAVQRGLPE